MNLLKPLLAHFQAWAQKGSKWTFRGCFWNSRHGPKLSPLKLLLVQFHSWAQKYPNWSFWDFWRMSRPGPQRLQNEHAWATFGLFPGLGPKIVKMCLLRLLLVHFHAWAQKYPNWAFWDNFWRMARPGPKMAQNEPSEATCGLFPGLDPTIIKMCLLRQLLVHFHAWAQK